MRAKPTTSPAVTPASPGTCPPTSTTGSPARCDSPPSTAPPVVVPSVVVISADVELGSEVDVGLDVEVEVGASVVGPPVEVSVASLVGPAVVWLVVPALPVSLSVPVETAGSPAHASSGDTVNRRARRSERRGPCRRRYPGSPASGNRPPSAEGGPRGAAHAVTTG
ncbi:hypothetical protein [Nannocystis pusilla]|uniref:hypothetical protein n=1 Tax=Nannocystis pusilla TaxID=889268 RepID=UPI003B82B553